MAPAINYPKIPHLAEDPTWRAEFRGFFWGEGWLGIDMYRNRRHGKMYVVHRPNVQIAQANSNKAILFHIQDVLGGTMYERKSDYGSQGARDLPVWTWVSRTNSTCRVVQQILSEGKYFPDKKLEKVEAFGKFLDRVEELDGGHRSDTDHLYFDDLRAIVSPNAKRREG